MKLRSRSLAIVQPSPGHCVVAHAMLCQLDPTLSHPTRPDPPFMFRFMIHFSCRRLSPAYAKELLTSCFNAAIFSSWLRILWCCTSLASCATSARSYLHFVSCCYPCMSACPGRDRVLLGPTEQQTLSDDKPRVITNALVPVVCAG